MTRKWNVFNVFLKVILVLLWGLLFAVCPYAVLVVGFGLLSSLLLVGHDLCFLWLFWGSVGWVLAFFRGYASFLLFLVILVVFVGSCVMEKALFSSELAEASRLFLSPYRCRKLLRFLFLLFPLGVFPVFGRTSFRVLLLVLGIIALGLEFLRFASREWKELLRSVFRRTGRPEEEETVSGVSLFLIGSALTALFPGRAGPIGITLLIVGDGWASLVGRRWGKIFWRKGKSCAGSLACVIASCIGALLIFPDLFFDPVRLLVLSIVSGIAEGAFRGAWDNLFMGPLVAFAFCLLE